MNTKFLIAAFALLGVLQVACEKTPCEESSPFLYFLLSKSSSMQGSAWDTASEGLTDFAEDPKSAGLVVGLSTFPRFDLDPNPGCDPNAYKIPEVPFAPLPENAGTLALTLALQAPDGTGNPVFPALGGGLLASFDLNNSDPERKAAVILVLGGSPDGPPACAGLDPTNEDALAELATIGMNANPPVRTYVIVMSEAPSTLADKIAYSGGTDHAFLAGKGIAFAAALSRIRQETCE